MERVPDVVSYAKNYTQVNFKIDYIDAKGNIANYIPDFLSKVSETKIFVVETKGLVSLTDPLKIKRLRQWCEDVKCIAFDVEFDFVYVDQEKFDRLTGANGRSKNELATSQILFQVLPQYE